MQTKCRLGHIFFSKAISLYLYSEYFFSYERVEPLEDYGERKNWRNQQLKGTTQYQVRFLAQNAT